jgi:hypothetical protein
MLTADYCETDEQNSGRPLMASTSRLLLDCLLDSAIGKWFLNLSWQQATPAYFGEKFKKH